MTATTITALAAAALITVMRLLDKKGPVAARSRPP
jgi:hypothetical protein